MDNVAREMLRKRVAVERFRELRRRALPLAEACLVKGEQPFPSLPDPADEPIVASALAGQAHVFVTGDKALLELQQVVNLPVISPRQFWEMLASFDESN